MHGEIDRDGEAVDVDLDEHDWSDLKKYRCRFCRHRCINPRGHELELVEEAVCRDCRPFLDFGSDNSLNTFLTEYPDDGN